MLKEFKEFAMRGNVMDMAVGIIIGAAFGKIVTSFVNAIISFVIVAFAIFMIVKGANSLKQKQAEAPAAAPTADQVLLTEIRDLLKAR